jgi:cytochrome c556
MNRILPLLALTLLATPALSGKKDKAKDAAASDAPADAVHMAEYRHVFFESMGKHMKMTAMVVKGQVDRTDTVKAQAVALREASLLLPTLFPEGTGPDVVDTDARPEIWTDRKGFEEKAKAFQDAAAKFVEVADGGDKAAIAAQFKQVGMSCGGCHDNYRVDDD